MSAEERCCTVSVACGSVSACLRVTFPLSYPSRQPEMRYLEGTRLSPADRQHVRKAWELTAEQHVKRNRSCLEPCLRNLAASLQRLMERQEETVPPLYQVGATPTAQSSATNFGNPPAQSCPNGRQNAQPPKLPALFPNCMHCRLNWPERV